MSTRPKAKRDGKTVAERNGLTAKEEALVETFLQYRNKSLAWERAGFTNTVKKSKVYAYFRKPHIVAAIEERLAENRLTVDLALSVLHDHAIGNMEHYLSFDADGNWTLDMDKARKLKQLGVVKKIMPNQHGVGIELHDPIRAIEIYGKVVGWIKETKSPSDNPANNDGDLDRLVEEHTQKP